MDNLTLTDFGSDYTGDVSGVAYASDVLVEGDGGANTLPTISDPAQSARIDAPGNYSTTVQQIMGAIGSAPQIAQSLGTAVGTAKANLAKAGAAYNKAETAAASGNSISTWWQYASGTDKAIVLIGIATLLVMLTEK